MTKKGHKRAESVLEIFNALGISSERLNKDINGLPKLLTRSPAAIFRLVAFLSGEEVRMPLYKVADILKRDDCVPLLDVVAPAKEQLRTMTPSHATANAPTKTNVDDCLPRQRVSVAYKQMQHTANVLKYEIGTEDLGKVIGAYPSVLLLDAEDVVLPRARYLMDGLGIRSDDIPNVLQSYPYLMAKGIDEMQRVVDFLSEQGVSPDHLSSIIRAFPALLMMEVADMKKVVDFLEEVGISNVGRFIT